MPNSIGKPERHEKITGMGISIDQMPFTVDEVAFFMASARAGENLSILIDPLVLLRELGVPDGICNQDTMICLINAMTDQEFADFCELLSQAQLLDAQNIAE